MNSNVMKLATSGKWNQLNSYTNNDITAPIKVEKKVGRNDPCPCGSGKKYKQCHGKMA